MSRVPQYGILLHVLPHGKKIMLCLLRILEVALPVYLAVLWMLQPKIGVSYLWKVNATPPAYLFGTVHIDMDLLWDSIPQNAKDAFEVSTSHIQCIHLK